MYTFEETIPTKRAAGVDPHAIRFQVDVALFMRTSE
jgi:hypothetical protein